jgi:hypothetical protein
MAFQPGARIDPTSMANNWGTRVGQSGANWRDKSLKPRRMFNADPAKAADAWIREVTQAQPRYESGLANTDLAAMEASITGPGMSAFQQAGTTKKAKFAKVAPALANAISGVTAALPADRSTPEAREARMIAQSRGMRALKGQIK